METLEGRVVWVTGAGSGIGRAVAVAFAAAGARVALSGRRPDALAETAAMAGTALVAPMDVGDAEAVRAAHAAVVAGLGEVDILVNNAGTNVPNRHWRNLSAADAAAIVSANMNGPIFCTLAVLPAMRARRAGLVIHIASLAATGLFMFTGPVYTATKTGHRALSAALNAEEGINGIRSVCINPGEVETDILARRPVPPSSADRALMVQPEDVAEAALFAARLPARTCISDMTVVPTDNGAHRAEAHAIRNRA